MGKIIEKDKKYVAGTYARFPVEIAYGKGSEMFDTDGKRYIDLGSGIGVTAFGAADEEWQAAVTRQLSLVQHTSNLYYTSPCADLAEMLCEKTGMKKVFFSNSGAEANECAIKAARKWAAKKKGSEYSTIVTLKNSFHGRTVTTLAATGQTNFHVHFGPLTPGFEYIDAGEELFELKAVCARCEVAAVMIECIQGEGGVVPLSREFITELAEYCKVHDILLIVDEVQTGNGRTGKLYSYMHYGIEPDIVTTAKGLGGGLPIGATLLSEKVSDVYSAGDHGSTFGGNPVCCAGAVNIFSRIDDALMDEVTEKSKMIFDTLTGKPGIKSVTGLGLMIGILPEKPAKEIVSKLIEKGVLCLTAKEKIRLLPALNIPKELLAEALDVIAEVCAE